MNYEDALRALEAEVQTAGAQYDRLRRAVTHDLENLQPSELLTGGLKFLSTDVENFMALHAARARLGAMHDAYTRLLRVARDKADR